MINIILLAVIGLVIGCAVRHIYKERKKGVKCIGCPDSAACAGNCSGCSCCGSNRTV